MQSNIVKTILILASFFAVNTVMAYNSVGVLTLEDRFPRFFYDFEDAFHNIASKQLLATDIKDDDKHYELISDVPGIDKKQIKVTFKERVLKVEVKINKKKKDKSKYILQERLASAGLEKTISRSFELPHAKLAGDIKVKLENRHLAFNCFDYSHRQIHGSI